MTDQDRLDQAQGRSLSNVGELFADISRDLSTLVRQEMELAKAEIRESATRAGKGAGMLGGAGVASYFVLLFLSIALWWGLGNEIGRAWAALVVAVVWAVIAGVLASIGRREIKQVKGIPQTTKTAREIPAALKGNEEHA
ncbi:phage holin family protein [Pedococcus sp. KACC 23699]|uniref:Phage holin family protein n=1 Tax=Pedococcus sp. KACC 23699 TaxID=3149228 RepID=A0AAU7JSJ0_9MICO